MAQLAASATAALLLLLGCASAQPEDGAPSILLITIDTLRADHLGAYGFSSGTSPHLDALADESTLF
jgi:glucan phosphoethanolaminetransferase (alkaline phosphatase superfamily)